MFVAALVWRDRNGMPVVVQDTADADEVDRLFRILKLRMESIPQLGISPVSEEVRQIELERLEKFAAIHERTQRNGHAGRHSAIEK